MSLFKRRSAEKADDSPQLERSLSVAMDVRRAAKKRVAASSPMEMSDDEQESPKSLSEAIMKSRKAKKMADGGEVEAPEAESDPFADMDEEADLKEIYGDDDMEKEEEEPSDMISSIRKKMKSRS